MRNRIYLLAFIVVQLITSCKNNDKTLTLTGENYKYWCRLSNPAFSYKFCRDGSCYYCFSQKTKDGKIVRKPYGFGGVVYANNWRFVNDKKIEIQEFDYYYELVGDSILKLKDVEKPTDTLSFFKTDIRD